MISVFCGIDVGTQGVRAVVVDPSGTVVGQGAAPLPAGSRDGGQHTQSPRSWWDALVPAVRDALDTAAGRGVAPTDVLAIALDATSGTVLVEDADGAPTGPALMYDDARAREQAATADRVGASLWRELGYRIQPSWALPKVLWLLANGGVPTGARVVHQGDHLLDRLAGHPVATDVSSALKTGADLRTVTWPLEILSELGVPVDVLPALVLPGTALGVVGPLAAEQTGLAAGTPLHAGMTDGCAAQIAAGALRPGDWSSALGTTLTIKGSTRDLVRDPTGAVYCHRHPDGGWLPGGASSTGAGAIALAFPDATSSRLAELTNRAATLPVDGPVAYPLAGTGERFPFVAPEAHGFGLDAVGDDVERFAAICRGIAYVERLAYDVLAVLGADVTGTVALTGGTTRNAWWNQLRTDVLGRVTVQPESAEAAVGMAVLAAAGPGHLTETAQQMVRVAARREPDPSAHAEHTLRYVKLVQALADRGWLDAALATAVLAPLGVVAS